MSDDVRRWVQRLEEDPRLPDGDGERFAGYGVMAAPFRSGHLLALRRFPASSVGPGYTSVWHRSPAGHWTFWSDRPPLEACPRYFGSAIQTASETTISLAWTTPVRLDVAIPAVDLRWSLHLRATAATKALNAVAAIMPESWWRRPGVLRLMAAVASSLLHAGKLGLEGQTPNGQRFLANPKRLWLIDHSEASLAGHGFGEPGPLSAQARLGDFWIPQRGLFVLGRAFFEPADPQRHRLVAAQP